MKNKIVLFAAILITLAAVAQDTEKKRVIGPPAPKLSHIHIKVRDLKGSIEFYREKLGFRLVTQQEAFAIINVGDGKNLFLDEAKQSDRVAPGGVTLGFSTIAVDEWYKVLKGRGVQLSEEPQDRPWGARSFYFPDPDGYTVEFEQVLKK